MPTPDRAASFRPRWTPEQTKNAMTYGVCKVCRAPREPKETWTLNKMNFKRRNGEEEFTVTRSIVCPNGHAQ